MSNQYNVTVKSTKQVLRI